MSCIISPYHKNRDGYALKSYKGKMYRHHRLVYEQEHGPIPKGMVIMHTCDNPPCINPEHLRLGTHQDNIADCVNKGRQPRGVINAKAKLTEQQILDIRNSTAKAKDLAIDYEVTKGHIYKIKSRRFWKHI